MRAVNLIPKESRRGRMRARPGALNLTSASVGPAQFIVAALVIVVLLVLLEVMATNNVRDQTATLAAVQAQLSTEQAQAQKYAAYVSFVQAAEQREAQVRTLATARFPWQQTLEDLSRVMPTSTSLTSLSATTSGTSAAGDSPATGPTITLAGCADTPDQDGVATLLRRLAALSGVQNVGFQNSTRQSTCGNSFNLTLNFAADGASSTAGVSSGVPAAATPPASSATTTTTTP
jgi:Tfp pilus assembly protein PilN